MLIFEELYDHTNIFLLYSNLLILTQYVITTNHGVLQHAIEQLKKIPLKEQRGAQERTQLKSLLTKVEGELGSQEVSFLQSFLLPIQKWADKHLRDYHLHFAEVTTILALQPLYIYTLYAYHIFTNKLSQFMPVDYKTVNTLFNDW